MTESSLQTYTIHPAKYAKGKFAIYCKPDGSGYKTLAALIISEMPGVTYSNREKSYICSPGHAAKFEKKLAEVEQQRAERTQRDLLISEARATGKAIDHLDGNPTNNTLANLRVVTLAVNR